MFQSREHWQVKRIIEEDKHKSFIYSVTIATKNHLRNGYYWPYV